LTHKVSRRSFVKYVGAGLVAATAAGAGYYFYGRQPSPTRTETATIPKGWESATTYLRNNPPVISEIDVKPKYINPTTETIMRFSHSSYDADNDPLSTKWLIDGEDISHEPEYSTKLSEGDHSIALKVSDGKSEAMRSTTVTVDSDQIYPAKPLRVKYRGVNYCVGKPMAPEFPDYPTPNTDQIDEELDNIHNDLGCNAIIIAAGADSEDDLIECARMALQKEFFDRIYIEPHYWQYSIDETVEKLARFAPKVKSLREASQVIHFMVGHEFSLETSGIVPGDNWFERVDYCVKNPDWADRVWATFPRMFKDIIAACKENYGYKISYAAISYAEIDAVPWSDPLFESVGIDVGLVPAVGATEEVFFKQLSELKTRLGKPVIVPDFACLTYTGAEQWGGAVLPNAWENGPYDEEAQAKYIKSYCDVLSRARIEGCFYWQYKNDFDKAEGLFSGTKRKKGFYMYKSYQRTT